MIFEARCGTPTRTKVEPTSTRGTRVANRFELLAPIPDLGVSEAWTARDIQGGEVRVTLLGAATPTLAETLGTALERLRPLSNPGILGTLDGGVFEGRAYAVGEPVDGRTLSNWLEGHRQAGTRPGFGVVQRLFDRVASALQAAHGAGVVHGALSPRCVVLKRVGQGQHHVRICDLALGPFTVNLPTTPSWYDYQAPEQRAPRLEDGAGVDVFAAAVVLVEMLTLSAGPRPDARDTWAQFARDAKGAAIAERLTALRNDVPRPVWDVVATGLAASAKERGANIQRLQRALREAWTAVGEWDRSAFAEPDPPAPDPSRVRVIQAPVPQRQRSSATVIEGWQSAERASAPAAPAPAPAYTPAPQPALPPRVQTAFAGTPVVPAAAPMPARTVPMPVMEEPAFGEATEAIDLEAAAMYLQQLHGAQAQDHGGYGYEGNVVSQSFARPEEKESTRAIDAEAFFASQLPDDDGGDLDDRGGTAVRAQGGDIAAAIAAAAAPREPDESTRMLDLATPDSAFDPRAGYTPWGAWPGAAQVPDPYGGSGMGSTFGVDDPFGGADAPRASIPSFGTQPVAWTAPQQAAPAQSPFSATLKAVPPRSSVPSAPAPSPQKLWGAAPAPGSRPSAVPVKKGMPGWQIGLIVALVLGIGAAVFFVLRGR